MPKRGRQSAKGYSTWDALGALGNELVSDKASSEFSETPVDIETFLYDKEYLNLNIRLSQPQLEFVDNCSRIFPEDGPLYTEGVLQVGQGAGKDLVSMLTCLRLIYLLLCLESPQKTFNMGDKDSIDIINVAPTAQSAKNIFFSRLKDYMNESPLFEKFKEMGKDDLNPSSNMIEFPKHIRMISGNSEHESWQGLNAIMIVLDEIDAFKSEQEMIDNRSLRAVGAEGVHETAVALVSSRFPKHGKVLSLSWPRFKGSFIQRRFLSGLREERTYVPSKEGDMPMASWDFNPRLTREDLEDRYKKDPIDARARYECDPPFAQNALFKDVHEVLRNFDAYLNEFDEISHWGGKRIRGLGMLDKNKRYYIHVDLSLTQANCALCITHNEGGKVVMDLLKVWEPPLNGEVDIGGVEQFIINLKTMGYKIEICTYDGFQSANSIQVLTKAGILASKKSVDRTPDAYHTLKDLVSQDLMDGYFDKALLREVLALDLLPNNKIAQRPGMLKDRADALAGAAHNAVLDNEAHGVTSMGDMNDIMGAHNNIQNDDNNWENVLSVQPNERGIVVNYDRCTECRKDNTMEYSNGFSRVMSLEQASEGKCLYCMTKFTKNESGILEKVA